MNPLINIRARTITRSPTALTQWFLAVAVILGASGAIIRVETMAQALRTLKLAPGSSMSGEIASSAKEIHEIEVEEGRLLFFTIDKGDLTLSTAVYGPNGVKLLDHISDEFEAVALSIPAEDRGVYRIELQSREIVSTPRRYELRVDSSATLTSDSRLQSEARQAMARAQVLRADWTESSLRQAIGYYDKAIEKWLANNAFHEASLTALRAGNLFFDLSNYPEALRRYRHAALLAQKAGDRVTKWRCFAQIGLVTSYIGNNDEAEEHLANALSMLERFQDSATTLSRYAYAEALSNSAEVSYARGDLVRASIQFERAFKVFQGDRQQLAKVLLFSGYIAGSIGDPQKAESQISKALELARSMNNRRREGLALTALGLFHSLRTDEEKAIDLHQDAIGIFQKLGDRHSEAIAQNALGQAYENLNEYAIAQNHYQKALTLFQSIGAFDLLPISTFKIAKVYRLTGDFDQAIIYYNRCLKLSRAAKKFRTEVNALNDVAIVYASQGHPEKALNQYETVRKFYERIGDRRGQATAWNTRGDLLFQLGQKKRALAAYAKALPLGKKAGDNSILVSTLYNLARVQRDLRDFNAALASIEESLKLIEDLRFNVGSPDFRASYFSGVKKHYDLNIDVLMHLHRANPEHGFSKSALLVSEKSRARLLLDLLNESHADLSSGATPELLARERELRGLIRAMSKYQLDLSLTRKVSSKVAEAARQMVQLRSEYQSVQARLRDQNSQALSLARFAPASIEQIQAELNDGNTLVLEYSLGDERSYLWAVTATSYQSHELPPRKVLEAAVVELYNAITARQGFGREVDSEYRATVESADRRYVENARRLSEMLLGPVAEQLGRKRLVFVTEGALQYLPWESLPAPNFNSVSDSPVPSQSSESLLIRNHEIVSQPSMSTLLAIRRYKTRPASPGRTVAVLADPVFGRSDDRVTARSLLPAIVLAAGRESNAFPFASAPRLGVELSRLEHASEEADAIFAAAPRGSTMIAKGFAASRETATTPQLGDYQIVHFATHGFLDGEHPELSGVVLSMIGPNGEEKNGLMTLADICNLDLSAKLTVLSACQTALGKNIEGGGLIGLTHSFFSAGSRSVVSSLWKVDDRATAILMADFYKLMLQEGMTPAAALRESKLRLMGQERWSAPYFWAGFVMQGEYSQHIAIERNSSRWVGTVMLAVLFSCGLLILHRRHRRRVR